MMSVGSHGRLSGEHVTAIHNEGDGLTLREQLS